MKKQNKNQIMHYENSKKITNKPLSKYYDNEFADDYEFESRQLELEREQIEKFTNNKKINTTKKKNKTAK